MRRPVTIALVLIVLIFGGLIIAWQSALYTLNQMSFKQITTTQMAADMRNDEFWSSNRFNTLIFNGQVKSINTHNNKTTLAFVTTDAYGVSCEVNSSSSQFKVGSTYKFAVESYQAERQPNGVLLHNCESWWKFKWKQSAKKSASSSGYRMIGAGQPCKGSRQGGGIPPRHSLPPKRMAGVMTLISTLFFTQ